jgi:hypothetical protein
MATVVKGGTAYAGVTETVSSHTGEAFSKAFAELVFNETAVLKALSVKAWNGMPHSVTKTTGKALRFDDGIQFSGKFAKSAPSVVLLNKGGVVNAGERNDWDGWAYDWQRLLIALSIPEEYIQDNQGNPEKLADLLVDENRLGAMGMADGVNKLFLGHADSVAPTLGLPYMLSVTQTGSIGGVSRTNSYWQNWHKDGGSPGGGGTWDKPLALSRKLKGAIVGTSGYASVDGVDLLISNEGGYLTFGRMSEYLDGLVTPDVKVKMFFDVGLPHMTVDGRPFIYDKAATLPWGGSTGDFIYGMDTNSSGLAFKRQEYFRTEPWLPPNARSTTRNYRSNIFNRVVPFIKDRRSGFVIHGITANTESTSD